MFKRCIKILIVEDNKLDALVLSTQIKRKIPLFEYEVCDNEKDFREKLSNNTFDVIISDYQIPDFGGMEALEIVNDLKTDTPFILVSGNIGEEAVVQMIHKGATDYLMKDRLDRIGLAIKNAIEKKETERTNKIAVDKLIESEERFRNLAEASPIGILLIEDELVSYGNKKAKEIGPECLQLIDLPCVLSDVKKFCPHEENCECLLTDIARVKNQVIEDKVFSFHDSNKQQWLEYFVSDSIEGGHKLQVLFRDVTDEMLSNQEIKKLSQALEVSPVAISIANKKGIIEYVNQMFTEMTGYKKEEVLGNRHSILKSGRQPLETYTELWSKLMAGEIWTGELLNKKRDGSLYWTAYTISGIKNSKGEVTHYIGISTDITSAKHLQEQLVLAKEKAEESDHLKSSFLANMSHEIRTPLNAIMGFSSLLPEALDDMDSAKLYVDQIERNGKKLLTLISDILDISKIESDTISLTLEQFSMNELLKNLKTDYHTILEGMGKDLVFKTNFLQQDVLIYSDRVRLYQVISNFVSNAFKYTDRGMVEVKASVHKKRWVRVEVIDTGIGISNDNMKNIFSQFFQVEDTHTRKVGGTGLGLAIVEKLSFLLNCRINAKSELGKGSKFTVDIPFFIY